MNEVENHYTILAASENLDKAIARLKGELFKADLTANDLVGLIIWVGAVEGVADFLREKAEVIEETQP
jgi:hypothetical protein